MSSPSIVTDEGSVSLSVSELVSEVLAAKRRCAHENLTGEHWRFANVSSHVLTTLLRAFF